MLKIVIPFLLFLFLYCSLLDDYYCELDLQLLDISDSTYNYINLRYILKMRDHGSNYDVQGWAWYDTVPQNGNFFIEDWVYIYGNEDLPKILNLLLIYQDTVVLDTTFSFGESDITMISEDKAIYKDTVFTELPKEIKNYY